MPRALLVALTILLIPTAFSQVEYRLEINTDEVFVGESFPIQLIIRNARSYGDPVPPQIPGCTVQTGGQRSFTQFVNGRRSEQLTMTYLITPRNAGDLVIPPFELEINGRNVKTNTLRVTVRPANDRATEALDASGLPLLRAEITCDAAQLVVGQQARFTLVVQVKVPARTGSQLTVNDIYSLMSNSRTGFGPFPEPKRADQRRIEMPDGQVGNYYEFKLPGDVVVNRTGPVTFEDLIIEMDYPQRISRDLFGRARVERSSRLSIRPKVVAPEVEPLPTDGEPASFNGAVGEFDFTVLAKPLEVRVGDPIELTLVITGNGPLETLGPPKLTEQQHLTSDFRVQDETPTGQSLKTQRVFSQTVRAKRSDVDEIPALEFPYYNPRTGSYEVAYSKPIRIEVQATEMATASDLLDLQSASESGSEVAAVDGLRGNITTERALLQQSGNVSWTSLTVATALPAVAFGGFWLFTLLQASSGRDPNARRRQQAQSTALQKLGGAAPAEVGTVLTSYVADRSGAPPESLTGADALSVLRQHEADQEVLDQFAAVMDAAEAAAYGGLSESELRGDAKALVARLERLSW